MAQPTAGDGVAHAQAQYAQDTATNTFEEIAGPEQIGLDNLAGRVLSAAQDSRTVLTGAAAPYFGAVLTPDDRSLLPTGEPAALHVSQTRLDDWLTIQR